VIGGSDPEGFPSAIRLGVPDVQNLANPPGAALADERRSNPMQPLLEPLQVVRSRPITRAESKLLSALVEPEVCQLRFAERGRTLENRIEHRLQVRRRAGDDPQDLAGPRLLLQSLLRLVEQPHILDGDDGLVGEDLEQGDLPAGEEPSFCAAEADRADRHTLPHQRHAELRPSAMLPRDLAAPRKLVRLALQVNDVRSAPIEHCSAVERFANQGDYESPGGDRAVMSDEQQPSAVPPEDLGIRRLAQPGRALGDCVKDRLDVVVHAADDL
jgi:hypothetical protein